MSANGWIQVLIFSLAVLAVTKPLGGYMWRVFETDTPPLAGVFVPIERLLCALCGVDRDREQDWKEYALSLLAFSAFGVLATYAILRLQNVLPLNPQGFAGVGEALAFNTATSFATNTNWQASVW